MNSYHTSRLANDVPWFGLEYALEGSSNYIAWKDRMEVVLENNGWKKFIDQEIPKPASTNAQDLAVWKKCVAKARRIILEGV